MRIRQQLRLRAAAASALTAAPGANAALQTRICRLNRSPWDVITFASESPPQQVQDGEERGGDWKAVEDGRNISSPEEFPSAEKGNEDCPEVKFWHGNGGNNGLERGKEYEEEDLKPVIKCIGSQRVLSLGKSPHREDDKEGSPAKEKILCRKKGSKGWKCKREAKEGRSLCEHHLGLSRSEPPLKPDSAGDGHRGSRLSKPPSSSASDFYYYSGFGPRWRKRKGSDADPHDIRPALPPAPPATSPSSLDVDGEQEAGGEADCRKKRKPIKARSLKSLL